MTRHNKQKLTIVGACLVTVLSFCARAGDLDTIGVTLLRQVDPTLKGNGVPVAQPEATSIGIDFEVNPAGVGQSSNLFTYSSSDGIATNFPNGVGVESGHADAVGGNFYGLTTGAAPQVGHVDNYEAFFFFTNFIATGTAIPDRVVNQSFAFSPGDQSVVDPLYDDFAAANNTIFVSAVGNGGPVLPPGTCYNGIASGAYAFSSVGPTADGRCKPDVTAPDAAQAPNSANSFSTPYVTGSAAILVQAALRTDGGPDTNSASDLRTIKALLMNGAVKPLDWTNSTTRPLDARYGAGMVNIYNSWRQLQGGKHPFTESTTAGTGDPHPPGANPGNESGLIGWDYNSISNVTMLDRINHYYLHLTGSNAYSLTATLVWNRQQGQTSINDLDLFLYDTGNSNLVVSSVSMVDNVEHLFVPRLPPGRYDLQVLKSGTGLVSPDETYALTFEAFSMPLNLRATNNGVLITWPLSPTGFTLQSTFSLTQPVWNTVAATVTVDVTNNQNVVVLPAAGTTQFFRLRRP